MGVKTGENHIFGSHHVRDAMRQLAAIETLARGLRILSNFRMEEKNITISKNVNSPFKERNAFPPLLFSFLPFPFSSPSLDFVLDIL